MAAILGADPHMLKQVTEEVTSEGYAVQIANMNSTKQIVISGTKQGVEVASQRAKENGAKSDSTKSKWAIPFFTYEASS